MTHLGSASEIDFLLVLGERRIPLAHIDPGDVCLHDAIDLPRCETVEIVILVNGRECRRQVLLSPGDGRPGSDGPGRELRAQTRAILADEAAWLHAAALRQATHPSGPGASLLGQ